MKEQPPNNSQEGKHEPRAQEKKQDNNQEAEEDKVTVNNYRKDTIRSTDKNPNMIRQTQIIHSKTKSETSSQDTEQRKSNTNNEKTGQQYTNQESLISCTRPPHIQHEKNLPDRTKTENSQDKCHSIYIPTNSTQSLQTYHLLNTASSIPIENELAKKYRQYHTSTNHQIQDPIFQGILSGNQGHPDITAQRATEKNYFRTTKNQAK